MAYSNVIDEIETTMNTVANIGEVHPFIRYWKTDADFRSLFQTTIATKVQIRGWTITRDGIPGNDRFTAGGPHRLSNNFVIRGYLSLEDGTETEKTFQGLVDAVIKALDENRQLNCNAEITGPATVPTISHREFGNVLCHYCEINYVVRTQELRTY